VQLLAKNISKNFLLTLRCFLTQNSEKSFQAIAGKMQTKTLKVFGLLLILLQMHRFLSTWCQAWDPIAGQNFH